MAKRKGTHAAEVKREAIMDAAKRLFGTYGYVATTMRQIASEVSMEGGSLYYHFKSKEELLSVLLSDGNESLIRAAEECLARHPDDPVAALRDIMTAHMQILIGDRVRFIIATTDLNRLSAEQRKRIIAQRRAYEKVIQDTIVRGVDAGAFRPCNVKVVSYAILSLMNGVGFWFKPDGPLTLEEVSRQQGDLLLCGLAAVNAVLDALKDYGVTHIDMPLTPQAVWRAIRDGGKFDPHGLLEGVA